MSIVVTILYAEFPCTQKYSVTIVIFSYYYCDLIYNSYYILFFST